MKRTELYDEASRRDAVDPLSHLRARFDIPAGIINLDGNSLGPMLTSHRTRLDAELSTWRDEIIGGWKSDGWLDLAERTAARIAPLLGTGPDSVIVADNTTANLYKALVEAFRIASHGERTRILTDAGNFPTDLYVASEIASSCGTGSLLIAPTQADVAPMLDKSVAVLTLTHVDYRTAARYDLTGLTERAHAAGALVVWDLSHTTGTMPLSLDEWGIDFAVGCGYKYLNGGPGAPSYIYVGKQHLGELLTPIPGWWGSADRFAMEITYVPASGILRNQSGTPSILSLAALHEALSLFEGIDLADVEMKISSLEEIFSLAMEDDPDFTCVSPEPPHRGAHLAYRHGNAERLVPELREKGILCDFRPPDICRFGLSPLYLSHGQILEAAEKISTLGAAFLPR